MKKSSQKKKTTKIAKAKKPQGRPSVFSDIVGRKIIELAGKGRTDKQIAEIIGVHETTVGNWKKSKPDLLWSIKEAKMIADEVVEASLFQRATGCVVPEEKVTMDRDGVVHKVHSYKAFPPDATSMIFWLKNRQPDKWRDRVEISTDKSTPIIINAGSTKEDI